MKIEIHGASEHNLKGIDVSIGDGLTGHRRSWAKDAAGAIRCTTKRGDAY
jgi:hypothetical protein